jgi:molybdenum cofactor cytidylyltransferase
MSARLLFQTLGAIVLAAGFSRRMGAEDKLLKPLAGGPLLGHAVARIEALGLAQTLIVAGSNADAVAPLVPDRATLLRNAHAEEGMGGSIACGAAALDPALAGVFIVLGDMPFVERDDYERLAAAFGGAGEEAICIPARQGRRGHPVLFAAKHFPALGTLAGDVGARPLLRQASASIREVEGCSSGIFIDLDDSQAFLAAEQRLRHASSGR